MRAFRDTLVAAISNYHHSEIFEFWENARNKNASLPLNFKGTAWLAGFPIRNAALPLVIAEENTFSSDIVGYDFTGPEIDAGFRLAKNATPRRLAISAELAFLMLSQEDRSLNFHYEGRVVLKDVDDEYPLIWIDAYPANPRSDEWKAMKKEAKGEDDLRGVTADKDRENLLRGFVHDYLKGIDKGATLPFIYEDQDAAQDLVPPKDYEKTLADRKKRLETEIFRVDPAEAAGDATKTDPMDVESFIRENKVSKKSAPRKRPRKVPRKKGNGTTQ